MTYQRNNLSPVSPCRSSQTPRDDHRATLQNGLDERLPDLVQQAQVAPGDHDEAEHDGRRLADLAPVRPLDAAQLVDAMPEERDDATAPAPRVLGVDDVA